MKFGVVFCLTIPFFAELSLTQFRESIDLSRYSWIHFEGRKTTKELVSFVEAERLKSDLKLKVSVEIEKTDRGLEGLFGWADLAFVSKDFSKHSGAGSAQEAVRMFKDKLRKGESQQQTDFVMKS